MRALSSVALYSLGGCRILRQLILLIVIFSMRLGEASHPGPSPGFRDFSFTLGAINPTGLNGKHGVVSQLDCPAVYMVSEAHLTQAGLESFSFRPPPLRWVPLCLWAARGVSSTERDVWCLFWGRVLVVLSV